MKSNKCIISLATKNSRYVDGLARLSNSLRDNAAGIDFLGFIHEHSVGARLHTEDNYGFKVLAIQKAVEAGYTQILWLDCSVWAVAPVQPIFDIIEKQGYWFEGAGCWLGDWCNDRTLDYFFISREQAKNIPLLQGGFTGFNTETEIGRTLLSHFDFAYQMGLFNGSWEDHRHDQTCLSIAAHRAGVTFSHNPEYVQYAGVYDQLINDKIIFKCQGL